MLTRGGFANGHGERSLHWKMEKTKQKDHPLSFVAFILAFLVLVAPLQVDVVFVTLTDGQFGQALMTVAGTLALVIVPLTYAQTQTRRHPELWHPRFLSKLTWIIVVLNVVMNLVVFTNAAIKMKAKANQSSEAIAPKDGAQPQL